MVKRYKPTVTKVEALCYGGEHPDGEFVRFADYSALAVQRDELVAAARAVIDRWETPNWKEAVATAEMIGRLRAALARCEK